MIGYLRGKILESGDGKLIVVMPTGDTSDSGGAIGYAVTVPQSAAYGGLVTGQRVELFIYTHVREDALDLYGFTSVSEKELFLTLLGVNGVGPKSALGILSGAEPADLIRAIVEKDTDFLTAIPGIGKKTAERITLELGDAVRKKMENGVFAPMRTRAGGQPGGAGRTESGSGAGGEGVRDAKTALVGLGYREQDVGPVLNRLIADAGSNPLKVEDLIRLALRHLGGGS